MNKICGIYKITNIVNGKIYIGSSIHVDRRWWVHLSHLRKNKHDNEYLQRSWNKYGESKFEISIVEACKKEQLLTREDYWMDYYNSRDEDKGYNLSSANRIVWSEKSKQKASASHMGAKNINFGCERSIETKQKISQTKIKSKLHHTEEWKKQHSEWMKGKQYGLGYKHTKETRAKMSKSQKNRLPFSEETKKKISESKKIYWADKRANQTNL